MLQWRLSKSQIGFAINLAALVTSIAIIWAFVLLIGLVVC